MYNMREKDCNEAPNRALCQTCKFFYHIKCAASSETQGQLVGREEINRCFISLPDLFPPTPTNCPCVSEDECAGLSMNNHLQPQLRRSCWTCTMCLSDALPRDLSFNSKIDFSQEQNDLTHSTCSEEDPLCLMSNMRQTHHNQDLLVHLNINRSQNKFDKLKEINKRLKPSLLTDSLTQKHFAQKYTTLDIINS